jgi:hypothetical protein
MTSPDETSAQLEAATAQAREVLGELRSELKEVRRVRRELDAAVVEVEERIRKRIDEEFGDLVKEGLDGYADSLRTYTDDAYQRCAREMQKMANRCMYGNEQGRGPTIFELIRDKLQRLDAKIVVLDGRVPQMPKSSPRSLEPPSAH